MFFYLWSCAVFKLHRGRLAIFPVVHGGRETPLPIPNRAVKPLSADGTWRATSWESRSPPVLYLSGPRLLSRAVLVSGLGGEAVDRRAPGARAAPVAAASAPLTRPRHRRDRLKAVLAEGGEVDGEVDGVGDLVR